VQAETGGPCKHALPDDGHERGVEREDGEPLPPVRPTGYETFHGLLRGREEP
jgi:hypothetical protein